jgi:hypothetical protein
MSDIQGRGYQFEGLVGDILRASGFTIDRHPQNGIADYAASLSGTKFLVEVKFYRTVRSQNSLLEAAASRLRSLLDSGQAIGTRGMLVVSCVLLPETRSALEQMFGLIFADRTDLQFWVRSSPELADRLNSVLEEGGTSVQIGAGRDAAEILQVKSEPSRSIPLDTRGTELSDELRKILAGRGDAAGYERLCIEIIQYLFDGDLRPGEGQQTTSDNLNRFDYICRIVPTRDFWAFLTDHLNSRYVIFEFKNYQDKISQGQILTTEKYLMQKALRRVAIMFTRKGANESALKMTEGAMRESGKLILILDDDAVIRMLKDKEQGKDPSDSLFSVADEFLMSLGR